MPLTILGPERPEGVLPAALLRTGLTGPLALISAGWRYDEARDELLRAAIPNEIHNLGLYDAFRDLERDAPDLAAAWTRKQDSLKRAKELYRRAIVPALAACQALWQDRRDPTCPWFLGSVAHLRSFDELFLVTATRLHAQFEAEVRPERHPLVRNIQARIAETLSGCAGLCVAGGHVGVLRNRMAFFGLDRWLRERHVIAWSGGAMLMCDRVMLYHDHTAYGPGTAEVLDHGFSLLKGVVFLPHARERLDLDNIDNVAILAHRLAPRRSIGLENGACYEGGRYVGKVGAAFQLGLGGELHEESP